MVPIDRSQPRRRRNQGRSQREARAWQRMLSGRRLDLLDPSPFDIEIDDIAHGLARVARWNGQTQGDHAFSVAQHSVLVVDIAEAIDPAISPAERLLALLHDAAEYVIGDMISPFKAALGVDYSVFEDRLDRAVRLRFGLPATLEPTLKGLIKRADRICAHCEAVQIAGFTTDEAQQFFGPAPPDLAVAINPLSARQAQTEFLDRFHQITAQFEAPPP